VTSKRRDYYERWLKGSFLTNILLPFVTAVLFLAGAIYAVVKWLKIL
jgi:hypothetical protein